MKTTATKLSVLAFLGLGLAVYGQSGKVGVNISSPRATLDVQPSATNSQGDAKTNEGILAPQLSKTRVASIEAPVEGTLVYVIDDATKTNGAISNYTGNDTKVAKITEKGYYYYNGTEWVKSTANSNGELWKEQDGNKVKLVSNIINNEVFYTANGYKFYPKGLTELVDYDYSTSSVRTSNLSSVKPLDLRVINLSSHEQPTPTSIGNYVYSGVKNNPLCIMK
ncbi:hypothetical protein LEQ04_00450 [Riemerella anatipestifer]|uniref:hypothetical protein n=1 Tax=Riemerella anatipestifer TaxID=34085 RepID=UPI000D694E86|nr:hypothetical protein [Riemerella anatipestifer]MRM84929.1 hypothetical protein [Riemerella anatipestifer]MRN16455.1 hypothetical protein [Riemerella anatipestifer]WPC11641.1 hypothetical protein LEQ05_04960 [Riemerella anatipestifer]WPC12660.1 hypothetical protein LEQ03_10665 [Riemerella anatipestifer]WPC15498.1 hypothetical protein LEQ04_00450 [Riemerella anatipestifer]